MKILIILNITDIYICSSFQSLNSALLWLAPRSEMSLPRSRHQATRESRNVKKVTEAERKYAEPGNIRVTCHVSCVKIMAQSLPIQRVSPIPGTAEVAFHREA